MQKIKAWWLGLSDLTRERIISAVRVFGSSFLSVLLLTLKNGGVSWTWSFWISLCSTGFSVAFKNLLQSYAPPSLGGIKKN